MIFSQKNTHTKPIRDGEKVYSAPLKRKQKKMKSVFRFKAPRSIRLLAIHGQKALEPKIEKGRFHAPLVSKRLAANLRKRSIIEGTFGSFSPIHGGWDPSWDTPKNIFIIKPDKGHLRDRNRPER